MPDEELTQEEKELLLKIITKRRNIYMLAWLIAFAVAFGLNILNSTVFNTEAMLGAYNVVLIIIGICGLASAICASLVVWCINNIRMVKTDGRKGGGGLLWILFLLLGGIIIPIIIVWILRKVAPKLGYKAIGLSGDSGDEE